VCHRRGIASGATPLVNVKWHRQLTKKIKNNAPGETRTHNPGIAQSDLCTVYKYRALTDCATGARYQMTAASNTYAQISDETYVTAVLKNSRNIVSEAA
jgi:hypothetical protein